MARKGPEAEVESESCYVRAFSSVSARHSLAGGPGMDDAWGGHGQVTYRIWRPSTVPGLPTGKTPPSPFSERDYNLMRDSMTLEV